MKRIALLSLLATLAGCDKPQQDSQHKAMNPELESVIKITAKQLNIPGDHISAQSTFASLGADDLDLVEIVMTAEEARKVSISDDLLTRIAGISKTEELVHHLTVVGFSQALSEAEPQSPTKHEGEVATGLYSELVLKPLPQGHTYLFIPSLAAILKNREDKKGEALTEAEVLDTRDRAPAMVVPNDVIRKMEESRQYQDIDPTQVWSKWKELRTQFNE
jgi:acyl carrier protein